MVGKEVYIARFLHQFYCSEDWKFYFVVFSEYYRISHIITGVGFCLAMVMGLSGLQFREKSGEWFQIIEPVNFVHVCFQSAPVNLLT